MLKTEGFIYTNDEGWILDLPSRLLFETSEHELLPEQKQSVAELSNKLKNIKIEKLSVQGHSDNMGSEEFNHELSEQRAQSVANIALKHGFSKDNIQAIGYGSSKPIKSNDTEEGRSENRRVSIIIVP